MTVLSDLIHNERIAREAADAHDAQREYDQRQLEIAHLNVMLEAWDQIRAGAKVGEVAAAIYGEDRGTNRQVLAQAVGQAVSGYILKRGWSE